MGDLLARFRAGYGTEPRHLLVTLACFTVTGWVVLRLAGETTAGRMLLWFLGAAIAHDLVLFPVYATTDRVLRRAARHAPDPPSLLNHVRVPALAAALLFLVYLPGILRRGGPTHLAATGQDQQPYLGRWLVLTSVLFLLSAVAYGFRRLRRRLTERDAGQR